jgi:hypothetical protein
MISTLTGSPSSPQMSLLSRSVDMMGWPRVCVCAFAWGCISCRPNGSADATRGAVLGSRKKPVHTLHFSFPFIPASRLFSSHNINNKNKSRRACDQSWWEEAPSAFSGSDDDARKA